jgi:hypothetical protein
MITVQARLRGLPLGLAAPDAPAMEVASFCIPPHTGLDTDRLRSDTTGGGHRPVPAAQPARVGSSASAWYHDATLAYRPPFAAKRPTWRSAFRPGTAPPPASPGRPGRRGRGVGEIALPAWADEWGLRGHLVAALMQAMERAQGLDGFP